MLQGNDEEDEDEEDEGEEDEDQEVVLPEGMNLDPVVLSTLPPSMQAHCPLISSDG